MKRLWQKNLQEAEDAGSLTGWEQLSARLREIRPATLGAIVVLCLIFVFTSIHRLHPTDLWGHLNYGRWIVENGRLPTSDPFRSEFPTERFVPAWWLSQVVGYGWYRLLGLEGLVLGHAVLVTLTAGLLLGATLARGVPLGWAAAAAAAACVLAIPILGVIRPQLFGMVAFSATLWGIARLVRQWDPVVWLGPVFALWANLHGSFLAGLGVLICHALGMAWDRFSESTDTSGQGGFKQRVGRLIRDGAVGRAVGTLVIAAACCCLNPEGVKIFATVAAFSSHEALKTISEWRPMTLQGLSGILMLGSVLLTGVLLRWSPRRIWASEVLLGLVFGIGALGAIRMLAWWALVWPWLAAPHAAAVALLYGKARPPREEPSGSQRAWRWTVAAAAIGLSLWWSPPVHALLTGSPRPPEAILSRDTPEPLAQFLLQRKIQGRLYAPLEWADYLVWRTHGAVLPLVHSHVHLIPPEVWEDFLSLERGVSFWPQLADKYQLDYIIVHRIKNAPLAAAVEHHPRCQVLRKDDASLLVRWKPEP